MNKTSIQGIKKAVVSGVFVMLMIIANSQVSPGLYLFPDNFRGQMVNPAFYRSDEANILALPALAGLSFNNSGSFLFSDMYHRIEKGNVILDLNRFENIAPELNHVSHNIGIPLFYYSLPLENGSLSFYLNEKIYHSLYLYRDALSWFAKGNYPPDSRTYNSKDININLLAYKEIAATYAFSLSKYVNIGFRGKLILGEMYLDASDWNYTFSTSENGKEIELITAGEALLSSPLWLIQNEAGEVEKIRGTNFFTNYFSSLGNPGLAFDFGMDMRISQNGELAASLSDLGFIYFQKNSHQLSQNDSYIFQGFDVTNSLDVNKANDKNYQSPYDVVISTQDKMGSVLKPEAQELNFTKMLFPKLFIQYKHSFHNNMSFIAANQIYFQKNNTFNLLTLHMLKTWKTFSLFGNISSQGFKYATMGGGFQWTTKYGQFFFATDNLLAAYHPAKQHAFTFSLGMNFLLNYYPPDQTAVKNMPFGQGKTTRFRPFFRKRD